MKKVKSSKSGRYQAQVRPPSEILSVAEPKARPDRPRILAVRRPGEPGTKRLVAKYGDRLLCVRYLEDEARGKQYKSVEIIVEEHDLKPSHSKTGWEKVHLTLPFGEKELCGLLYRKGGRWDSVRKVWRVRRQVVEALGLEHRIIETP